MTFRRIPVIIRGLLLSGLVLAAGAAVADDIRYRVVAGDTLIGLGERFLARPSAWPRLQQLNGVADPYSIPVGTVLRIPRGMLRPEPRAMRVEAVSGAALADGRALAAGDEVKSGARLSTGADGHVSLRLPDGSTLELPARSRLQVERLHGHPGLAGEDVGLRLEEGRVESHTEPQRGPAARYRIETPTAVIGVRGTDFRVANDAQTGISRAEVTHGRVEVGARGVRRALDAGFGLLADGSRALGRPQPLPPAPDLGGWPTLFIEPVVRFALPAVDGAERWRVQVAANPDFRPVLAERSARGEVRFDGLPDGEYHLRARLVDAQGLEGHDALHSFRLKARPEPPFPGQPADLGKAPAGPVSFAWSGAPEAASYRFELVAGEDFSAPGTVREALSDTGLRRELAPGSYRWRVASVRADGDQGPWSAVSRLVVREPAAVPEPPEVGEDTLAFRWAGEPGQRFDYQFAVQDDFAEVLHAGTVAEPAVQLPRPAPDTYYMRVRAIDAEGFVGAWSGAQRIIVPADFPWWMLLLPLLAL